MEEAKTGPTDQDNVPVGEDHFLGVEAEELAEGMTRVAVLVEKLEADGITCEDISLFSVAIEAAKQFNGATFRPQDALKLSSTAVHKEVDQEMVGMRLPLKEKQTDTVAALDEACLAHEIEGQEVVRWIVVMSLIGREFLRKHQRWKSEQVLRSTGSKRREALLEGFRGDLEGHRTDVLQDRKHDPECPSDLPGYFGRGAPSRTGMGQELRCLARASSPTKEISQGKPVV